MNKLSSETSPYLLQHATNPVHWLPWGKEALQLALQQDKPILLSIGYSACHWCHVMAHESFEDAETANLMNHYFINIKVDCEERPDIDKTYQTAHSILTNRAGGWPLTVFLTPDEHMPIFAGTYFPKSPRHGLPSFTQVLEDIYQIYKTRKSDINTQNNNIREALNLINKAKTSSGTALSKLPLDAALNQIDQHFDKEHGGYSKAPKFPHPSIIDFSLRHWALAALTHTSDSSPDAQVLPNALFSLEKMNSGGLFDHLGGGFYRYSTDDQWMIPHFEKMLYDNGPLLWLNTQAWSITHDEQFRFAATETANWVLREMQSPDGGYYSSLDADSEGEEGKFYAWNPAQVKTLLDNDTYPVFAHLFGLNRPANFEGQWHLHTCASYRELASQFNLDINELHESMNQARQTLFSARESRIHPALDDKILTSWNGLMIKGMAHAGRILNNDLYIESAIKAAHYIKNHMWQNDRLLATSKNGVSHLNAYLDDYAFLLSGLIELLQSQWDTDLLIWAQEIANILIEQFEDTEHGGFFFTSHDHEKLIQRLKTFNDAAMPSGNGMAACALLDLGYLCSNPLYLNAAERCLKAAWHDINQAPISHCALLNALDKLMSPPIIAILRGNAENLKIWQQNLGKGCMPHTLIFAISKQANLPVWLEDKRIVDHSKTYAYICEGQTCHDPITSFDEFSAYIGTINKSEST